MSRRTTDLGPARGCVIEFEDVLAATCGARLISPDLHFVPARVPRRLRHEKWTLPPETLASMTRAKNAVGPRILLVSALHPGDLDLLKAIPNWRRHFDIVCAYIFDAVAPEPARATLALLDHVFVPAQDALELFAPYCRKSLSFVPLACDVWKFGSSQPHRFIDLMGYGRQWRPHGDVFEQRWNQIGTERLYHHTVMVSHVISGHEAQRRLFWKMLHRSQLALAYDLLWTGGTRFTYSMVSQRWFESLAAGCVVVGRRPTCNEAQELLGWQDATIELPEDAGAACETIESLWADAPRLEAARQRNYAMMLQHHDWRHRIAQILHQLQVALPPNLSHSLEELHARTTLLDTSL
ncbi:glycosyltransferase [Abditibacterium utsteinense]|uniref:glycosyltransferase n=1 Tax=Abditibacterium utsteinense TaxID=1960156 RepID=UPI0013001E09|nr:glycosyltransferase [Abditibacterium utsteinense]